jgi:hypothetical protein
MDTDFTQLDEDYWQHLLDWVDLNIDFFDCLTRDNYEELFNDRIEDA